MNNWFFTQKELEAMRAMGAAGEMPVWVEQFEDVFKHPLQAIGPALWLVGRWAKMGFCK